MMQTAYVQYTQDGWAGRGSGAGNGLSMVKMFGWGSYGVEQKNIIMGSNLAYTSTLFSKFL